MKERLGDTGLVLVDTRSPAEYAGQDVRARRGGHIPGAVSVEWSQNLRADGRFKAIEELRAYCQTHHRAVHTYFVLRRLGYPKVVGYDRSWSEWGNRTDLPVETVTPR